MKHELQKKYMTFPKQNSNLLKRKITCIIFAKIVDPAGITKLSNSISTSKHIEDQIPFHLIY